MWDQLSERPKTKNRKRSRVRILKRLKRLVIVVTSFILIVGGLGYLFREPIQAEMKSQLEVQLEKNGIHANYVTRDFNLWRGLILSDVAIFESERKERPVLNLSGIGVAYNLLDLIFSGGTSAVRLSMENSTVSLWENHTEYTISGINTEMSLGRNRVNVEEFSAIYGDLNLNIKARVDFAKIEEEKRRNRKQKDGDKKEPDEKKKSKKKGIDVQPAIDILKQIPNTPDGRMNVALAYDFSGNARSPKISGQVSGVNIRWKEITVDRLRMAVNSRSVGKHETRIQIPQAEFSIGDREFSVKGEYDPVGKTVRLDTLESSIHLKPIVAAVMSSGASETSDDKTTPFPDLPDHRISATGVIDVEEPLNSEIQGNFELLSPSSIPLKDGNSIRLNTANLVFQLDNRTLKALKIDAGIGPAGNPISVGGAASVSFGEDDKASQIGLEGFLISQGTGSLAVIGDISLSEGRMELKQARSDLDFVKVLTDLGLGNPLKNIAYSSPPRADISGTLSFERPSENDLHGSFSVPGEVLIEVPEGRKPLKLNKVNVAAFTYTGTEINLQNAAFEIGEKTTTALNVSVDLKFEELPDEEEAGLKLTSLIFEPIAAQRDGGELYAEGKFDPVEKKLSLKRVESSLDLMAVLGEFGVPDALAGKVSFPSPPTIAVMGEIPFEDPSGISLKGSISSGAGISVAIGADRFLTVHEFEILEFIFRDSSISIPQILARAGPSGSELTVDAAVEMTIGTEAELNIGKAIVTRNDRRLELKASMPLPVTQVNLTQLDSNLDVLAAMADFGIGDPTGGKVRFNEPPLISAQATIDLTNPEMTTGVGTIEIPAGFTVAVDKDRSIAVRDFKAGECRIVGRGMTMEGLNAIIDAGNTPIAINSDLGLQTYPDKESILGIKKLNITREQGVVDFVGAIPLGSNKIVITSLTSTIDPIGTLIDLGIGDPTQGRVAFKGAPTITGSGEVAFGDVLQNSMLQGEIKAPEGATIRIDESQALELSSFETTYGIGNGGVATPKLVAQTMGGTIQANTLLRPLASPLQFEVAVRLTDIRLEELTGFFDAGSERTGLVSGEFRGGGQATLEGVQGVGSVQVEEARLTQLTLFKGLRPLLMAINLGEWKSEDLGAEITANFALNRGVLGSEDIELLGDYYRIKSKMNIDFLKKNMNAQGAVSTTGATRVVTEIVGKILEVEADGPFDDINWKLKNAPGIGSLKDLTSLSGDLLKNTLTGAAQPGKLIQNAGNVAKDTLGNAGRLTSDIGKKILGIGKKKDPAPTEEVEEQVAPPAPTSAE